MVDAAPGVEGRAGQMAAVTAVVASKGATCLVWAGVLAVVDLGAAVGVGEVAGLWCSNNYQLPVAKPVSYFDMHFNGPLQPHAHREN